MLAFFAQEVAPERHRLVRYEDLVRDPQGVMREVCDFLQLPFDEAVVNPYDGRKDRMMGGIGDPNILQHSGIDPKLGDAWRDVRLPRVLDDTTKALAEQFGYELPEQLLTPQTSRVSLVSGGETAVSADIPTVDELSDAEVADMLAKLLMDNEGA